MKTKKTIADIDVTSKKVLIRVDFNVPQGDQGNITDDNRIRKALPSIKQVLDGGGSLILMSHLGRPNGENPEADKKWTLAPVAKRLGELLGQEVIFAPDCVGPEVEKIVAGMEAGQCCLLENVRFHAAEQIKDEDASNDPVLREQKDNFAKRLADLADVYVNDAFGTCHRDNASMLTVPQHMEGKPRVVGFLVEKELQYLGEALNNPQRPFVAILGGKKVSDKIGVIKALLSKCDAVLIGGAMTYTFMTAQGRDAGKSKMIVEMDKLGEAKELLELGGEKLKLPVDCIAATDLQEGIETQVIVGDLPENLRGLDIGPETCKIYSEIITNAKTVVWNGPMGVFEIKPFDVGTMSIAQAVADATDKGAISVIGGGDSALAIDIAGLSDKMSHVSTGGGASMKFMEGKPFAAVDVLDDV